VLLLWEYQRASHGRRQLEWSRGRLDLRTFAGVRDQTDDEIAAEETGGRDLIALSEDTWSALTRAAAATELLDVAETGGITAATGVARRPRAVLVGADPGPAAGSDRRALTADGARGQGRP
jgi:hypothetical protein